jgi:asparagine synthase (glutamine-hydrolysing)
MFSASAISNLVERHLSREANLGYHLWGLATLHLWIRRWGIETADAPAYAPVAVLASAGD